VPPGGGDLVACPYCGEDEAWSGVAAGEAVGSTVGLDDVGRRGEVDLNGVAEPEPMLRANPVVRWQERGRVRRVRAGRRSIGRRG
jgi:hypothetical protein